MLLTSHTGFCPPKIGNSSFKYLPSWLFLPPLRIPLEKARRYGMHPGNRPTLPSVPGKRRLRHFPEIGGPDGFLEMNLPPHLLINHKAKTVWLKIKKSNCSFHLFFFPKDEGWGGVAKSRQVFVRVEEKNIYTVFLCVHAFKKPSDWSRFWWKKWSQEEQRAKKFETLTIFARIRTEGETMERGWHSFLLIVLARVVPHPDGIFAKWTPATLL